MDLNTFAAVFGSPGRGGPGKYDGGLFENGSFEDDSYWILTPAWEISDGSLNCDGTLDFHFTDYDYDNSGTDTPADSFILIGKSYRLTMDITVNSGVLQFRHGTTQIGGSFTTTGVHVVEFTNSGATNDKFRIFNANAFNGSINSLNLVEIVVESALLQEDGEDILLEDGGTLLQE